MTERIDINDALVLCRLCVHRTDDDTCVKIHNIDLTRPGLENPPCWHHSAGELIFFNVDMAKTVPWEDVKRDLGIE